MTPEEVFQDERNKLSKAAKLFAASGEADRVSSWDMLTATAEAYAKARWALKTSAPTTKGGKRSGQVVPFGNSKGTPIEEADLKDLKFLARVIPEAIADESKSKWRQKNVELLEAVEAELAAR